MFDSVPVSVKILRPGAVLPKNMSSGAAGADVTACLEAAIVIAPGQRALVPTGLAVAIPDGFEIQVRPRSGLAAKKGLTVLNTPGTIDCDYRGEIHVLLANFGDAPVAIEPGERIAQFVLQRVPRAAWHEVSELPETARGAGGFGSTGQ
jgi:dUTP pyrophosphatase